MKKVLVTQRLVRVEGTPEVRDCLDAAWGPLLHGLGWLAIPFPTRCPVEDFLRESPCDALLLSGGNDLSSVSPDPLSALRDSVEKELLAAFLERGLPVVGVCRGMQLVGDAFGMGLKRVAGHRAVLTPLAVEPATPYGSLLAALEEVNAYHDYALEAVRAPFAALARSPDGVIKAMACPERKVFCQMWHPERRDPAVPAELEILRRALAGGPG